MSKAINLVKNGPLAIREATGDKSVVVLYPRNRYRDAYLSRHLKEADTGLFYYALQTSDRNLRKFLNNLIEDLNLSTDGFGENLRNALSSKAKAEGLAEALAADLNTLSSEPFSLLLDQYDRLPEKDETKVFMEALVENIPPQCQIIINAREQAYLPWFDLVSDQKANVLGAEYVPEEAEPLPPAPDKPRIEVFSLGRGYALVNGTPVTQWDGELPKNLFFYFMDKPLITRDEIFDVFWENLSVKEATNVFHVTKRKINERLGCDLTQYASGFYNHSDQVDIYYDVASFSEAIDNADSGEGDQAENWERATKIYRAPFLHRLDKPWARDRRQELLRHNAQALIGLGRIRQSENNIDEALRCYSKALNAIPEREDIHRQVMNLYYETGNTEKAVTQFQTLETALRSKLNITPSAETVNLYKLIVGEE